MPDAVSVSRFSTNLTAATTTKQLPPSAVAVSTNHAQPYNIGSLSKSHPYGMAYDGGGLTIYGFTISRSLARSQMQDDCLRQTLWDSDDH